ncbi:HAD family hydrolase [Virgibacillus sp. FSP13]
MNRSQFYLPYLVKNKRFTNDIVDRVLVATIMKLDSTQASLYEIEADIRLSQVNIEGVEHCYDIIRKSVNKGVAIKNVLKRLDIPKEKAIAFGDGMNDKEMLQIVGEGFAMGNAHPDLFDHAKHRTTSVRNRGYLMD